MFFTTLATYGFWLGFCDPDRDRRFLWLFYIGMALGTLAKGPLGILVPLLGIGSVPDPDPAVETLFRGGEAAARPGPSVFSLPRPGISPCWPSTARTMPRRLKPIPPGDLRIPWRGTAERCCFMSLFSCSDFSRGADCSRPPYGTR